MKTLTYPASLLLSWGHLLWVLSESGPGFAETGCSRSCSKKTSGGAFLAKWPGTNGDRSLPHFVLGLNRLAETFFDNVSSFSGVIAGTALRCLPDLTI
jgi:hypothetical protein